MGSGGRDGCESPGQARKLEWVAGEGTVAGGGKSDWQRRPQPENVGSPEVSRHGDRLPSRASALPLASRLGRDGWASVSNRGPHWVMPHMEFLLSALPLSSML